ncbi:hypothetical protein F2Q70_00029366 [Brassica cretica]|uniref:Uncharacterized protein n=1 Tax=Brassica cretica TaxID=69181 RepID=A0A8S9FDF5_BRACR|nr:hypothetical protein F2Q70_00029366 [Brassica cretica]
MVHVPEPLSKPNSNPSVRSGFSTSGLARGRRDGRGDSSDLNLQIVAEVASSWSQLCQFWWVSKASQDWPVEEVCPDNLHISGEVHERLLWVALPNVLVWLPLEWFQQIGRAHVQNKTN